MQASFQAATLRMLRLRLGSQRAAGQCAVGRERFDGDAAAGFSDENMRRRMQKIIKRCKFKEITRTRNDEVGGKKFVITGNVNIFKNRDDLKQKIEISGGQVVSSVSSNTDFLINNDRESTSSKNKKDV